MNLQNILNTLRKGDLSIITNDTRIFMNEKAGEFLKFAVDKVTLNDSHIVELECLIRICNILYNRTDMELLPIDDGVYDLLLEYYKKYNQKFQIGSEVINFAPTNNEIEKEIINPIRFYSEEEIKKKDNDFFYNRLISIESDMDKHDLKIAPFKFTNKVEKRTHNTSHNHPELVGTLDKCKFVLVSDTLEKGVDINDSEVKILERDFFADHIKRGIIGPNEEIEIVLELKYDGISVEADCTNVVESARTRGDTGIGKASDITPILDGYPFKHASDMIGEDPIGVKFEAIMTHCDLWRFNQSRGKNYKNCRTAIIGLFGAGDANLFRDYITLVPLAIDRENVPDVEWNRLLEIEFLNKYFRSKCQPLRYAYIKGDYKQCLYYIKAFSEEAEAARSYLDFMYDGIVVSYLDENIRAKLGRENFINKYSMAVKFNPLKKQTIFRGYTYTVGQDGSITPMIHYDQVEFFGSLHVKSTANSYDRFKKLDLRVGDTISVVYVNDVMPRVYKIECAHNDINRSKVKAEEFIKECPICGSKLEISTSGKTVICTNMNCSGRYIARMSNMMDKLNLNDFAESTMESLGFNHFYQIIDIEEKDIQFLGPGNAYKFISRMNEIKNNPIHDYIIIGALGFSGIASKKWQYIFDKITLKEFYSMWKDDKSNLRNILTNISGIGDTIVDTIFNEFEFFEPDILRILQMNNIIDSKGSSSIQRTSVRCTGFRDPELMEKLRSIGLDADDNASVTKTTDILIIPYDGFTSSKTKKTGPNTRVVTRDNFITEMKL